MNLLVNAIQSIDNEGYITIRLSFDSVSNRVNLSIADTGSGISPEIANKVFHPFFTTKPVGNGTGMGLSISKQIVTEHGGTITFESSKAGTTFTVQLPINNPDDLLVDREIKKGSNANLFLSASAL